MGMTIEQFMIKLLEQFLQNRMLPYEWILSRVRLYYKTHDTHTGLKINSQWIAQLYQDLFLEQLLTTAL